MEKSGFNEYVSGITSYFIQVKMVLFFNNMENFRYYGYSLLNYHEFLSNHGSFRLFRFKSELDKFPLQKPKLQLLQSAPVSIILDVGESDEENQPLIKKNREASSNISRLIRYDGLNH